MDNHDIFKKTLRWIEPFGGWGQAHNYFNNFNVSLSNNDTGLCNRIFHWEIAHFLSEINKNSHKIQIQQKLEWAGKAWLLQVKFMNTILSLKKKN